MAWSCTCPHSAWFRRRLYVIMGQRSLEFLGISNEGLQIVHRFQTPSWTIYHSGLDWFWGSVKQTQCCSCLHRTRAPLTPTFKYFDLHKLGQGIFAGCNLWRYILILFLLSAYGTLCATATESVADPALEHSTLEENFIAANPIMQWIRWPFQTLFRVLQVLPLQEIRQLLYSVD